MFNKLENILHTNIMEKKVLFGGKMGSKRDKRYNKKFIINIDHNGTEQIGITSNISENGIYIELNENIPNNSIIILLLAIDDELYEMRGEVKWSKRVSEKDAPHVLKGMGVKIVEANPEYINYVKCLKYDNSENYISKKGFDKDVFLKSD